jgi:hypothetical protein
MIDYCTNTLNKSDIIQWLHAFRSKEPDKGDKYFLWGSSEYESGGPKPLEMTASPKNRNVRFIYPLIAAISPNLADAKSDNDSKETSYFAEINGTRVPPNAIKRLDADAGEGLANERYVDGYWVCVSNLSNGDKIRFGGSGPGGFTTEALWTVSTAT